MLTTNYPKFYLISAVVFVIGITTLFLQIFGFFLLPLYVNYIVFLSMFMSSFVTIKFTTNWARRQKLAYELEVKNVRNKRKNQIVKS